MMYTFQANGGLVDRLLLSLLKVGAQTFDQLAVNLGLDKKLVLEYTDYINDQMEPKFLHIDDVGIVSLVDYPETESFLNNGGFEKWLFYEKLFRGIYRKSNPSKNEIIWFNNLYDQGCIDIIDNSSKLGEDKEFKFNQRGQNRYEAYTAGLNEVENKSNAKNGAILIHGDYISGDKIKGDKIGGDKVEGVKAVGDNNKISNELHDNKDSKPIWRDVKVQVIAAIIVAILTATWIWIKTKAGL